MARVLVVDDHPDIRKLVTAILSGDGHEVSSANDGRQALEVLAFGTPDVLVLDVMMPLLDGYAVLEMMQAQGLLARTKVLMLTAKNDEADWVKGYEMGVHHYLTKPFDPDDLSDVVSQLLAMSGKELEEHREDERDRALLLARLESLFD
jgi:DNA-binding response OmpR family regulator